MALEISFFHPPRLWASQGILCGKPSSSNFSQQLKTEINFMDHYFMLRDILS